MVFLSTTTLCQSDEATVTRVNAKRSSFGGRTSRTRIGKQRHILYIFIAIRHTHIVILNNSFGKLAMPYFLYDRYLDIREQ